MIHPSYHMLAPAILSTQACCLRTTPYITTAEQQARTLRDRRTMCSHTGQYDHTFSEKQLYQVTHSLYPENVTPKIFLLHKSGRNREKKHPITPNQMFITEEFKVILQIETHSKN